MHRWCCNPPTLFDRHLRRLLRPTPHLFAQNITKMRIYLYGGTDATGGRPAKPFTVLTSEKKSHRTKRELLQRREGEAALLSGVKIKEAPEVRSNEEAHKEYRRVKKLLTAINKEDELYGAVINRYCLISAEIKGLEADRKYYAEMLPILCKYKIFF